MLLLTAYRVTDVGWYIVEVAGVIAGVDVGWYIVTDSLGVTE